MSIGVVAASFVDATPGAAPYSDEVLADSPLVYWRLGEAAGASTAVDASGSGHDGTYLYPTDNPASLIYGVPSLLTSDPDTAVRFAGYSTFPAGPHGYISINAAAWMNIPALTLECWIETTSGGLQALWDRDPGTGQRPFQLRLNNGKVEFIRISNAAGATAPVGVASSAVVNDGDRHHVTVTYDGATVVVYIDGAVDTTAAVAGGITAGSTDGLRFGYSVGGLNFYAGVGDEVAYYGAALAADRIAAHYAAGIAA